MFEVFGLILKSPVLADHGQGQNACAGICVYSTALPTPYITEFSNATIVFAFLLTVWALRHFIMEDEQLSLALCCMLQDSTMKWSLYMFAFKVFLLFPVVGQTLTNLPTDTNTISYKGHYGNTVELSVRHLLYTDKDGFTGPTDDCYIFEVMNGDHARIVDRIHGVAVGFQLKHIGGTNEPKLLVFYHAGAHQYCVKLYRLDDIDIIPLNSPCLSG
jgi:hypothetical protein